MSQHAIEVILTRQLAEYLSTPAFVVDKAGELVFYNEPAERILGLRFEETGAMPAELWSRAFTPTDAAGNPLPPDSLPLVFTLQEKRPALRRFFIEGLDGVRREIEVASFPMRGHGGRSLGAVALFFEVEG